MEYKETRIAKLRDYLIDIITSLTTNNDFQINANMLSEKVDNYSLDKIPDGSTQQKYVDGTIEHKDLYSFRSRMLYSKEVINNLSNIGFFEEFQSIIENNNMKRILPKIEGIESIECLNQGTMINADGKTAEFDIQIQIVYEEAKEWKK